MPIPYSQDLRDRVLAACDRAMKTKQIADLFGVSRSWVRRVKQRRREYGEVAPRPPVPEKLFQEGVVTPPSTVAGSGERPAAPDS